VQLSKHREILIELLLYYLDNIKSNHTIMKQNLINNIKAQNIDGEWYINYYINDYGKGGE
jgi:molybdopterin synthase catalytic subunit